MKKPTQVTSRQLDQHAKHLITVIESLPKKGVVAHRLLLIEYLKNDGEINIRHLSSLRKFLETIENQKTTHA